MKALGQRGFTLVELAIVVAIIAILATMTIPQYASLLARSQEATTKGNLAVLRSALSLYYSDNMGIYPDNSVNTVLSDGKYLTHVPVAYLPNTTLNIGHKTRNSIAVGSFAGGGGPLRNLISDPQLFGAGPTGWIYDWGKDDAQYGLILVNCKHSDMKNQLWDSY